MMKRMRLIYALLLAAALPLLTACSNDDALSGEEPARNDGKVSVHLRISQAAPAVTRAWEDNNAEGKEMMNIWTVVAVEKNTGKVAEIQTCMPTDDYREIDDIADITELHPGEYIFYSFANIAPPYLENLFGFDSETIPFPEKEDEIVRITAEDLADVSAIDIGEVDAKTTTVNGNLFDKFEKNDNNGFGYYGIPMSNKQTITIKADTKKVDLVVVRMMAKIELQIYNDRGQDVTIESITLSDVTANVQNNLKWFPKYTDEDNANKMENPNHGDIRPNLNGTPSQIMLDNVPVGDGKISKDDSYQSGNYKKITFYVNESVAPTNKTVNANGDFTLKDHFLLKIKLQGETEELYALIDDKGETSKDNDMWGYIARNDYRIIPIVLDDYKLELIPYDFTAIGVYPTYEVKGKDVIINNFSFHDYGHFHLLPKVTKYSDPNKTPVPFTATTPQNNGSYSATSWGLLNNNFEDSWKTWESYEASLEGDAVDDGNPGAFYRKDHDADNEGDETGGVPAWWPNNSSPIWSPDGTYKGPFIFGYIKNPGEKPTADKKVYHEFSIYLYQQGMESRRVMTYRVNMILSKDQMMYPSRRHGVSAVRHTHGY